ncbi:hypothetical protein [Peribacillus sp. SCS-155]|uniref:hypothetical protein n=1 Tax=Peribacillus sedimenti TaxID=3115297 RepID=UPI003906185C
MYFPETHYPSFPFRYMSHAAQPVYPFRQQFPSLDVSTLQISVKRFRELIAQANILLNSLENRQFAQQIMASAQKGDDPAVQRLVRSIGVRVPVTTRFTPTGVFFNLRINPLHEENCCSLSVGLRWGE